MSAANFGRTGRCILGGSAFVGVAAVVAAAGLTIGHSVTPKVPTVTVTHSPTTPSTTPAPSSTPVTTTAPTTPAPATSATPTMAAPTHVLHEYVGTSCEVPGEPAITVDTGNPLACTNGTWQAVAP